MAPPLVVLESHDAPLAEPAVALVARRPAGSPTSARIAYNRRMRIGVLSDTHGILHPAIFDLFRNVHRIVHAGDLGSESVVSDLESLAPLDAVRGNVDVGTSLERFPAQRLVDLGGIRLFVTHVGGEADEVIARHGERLRLTHARVFVCGHSHRALVHDTGGILVLNPGGAGRRRFSLPLTAALLDVSGGDVSVRLVDLDDAAAVEAAQNVL